MSLKNYRPTVALVDLSAIADNIRGIRARVGDSVRIMPAVKANGYGHGAVEVSKACLAAGADALCVAMLEEAVQLRQAEIKTPIMVLGCSTPDCAGDLVKHDVESTVCDLGIAQALSDAAKRQGKLARVHLKVDTGMGRIGVRAADAVDVARKIAAMPNLKLQGIFTHFPSADDDSELTQRQVYAMGELRMDLASAGVRVPVTHMSNSAAILARPEADFDAVRPGIMIYGHYPSPNSPKSVLIREALTLKTQIVFLKECAAGTKISYGGTHVIKRKSNVATIPIGYGDGYPRALSNKGEAAVKGARVSVIGRVCMDQVMLDVTDVPEVGVGDEVILYGGGFDYLSVSRIAGKLDTISYELLCAIGRRVPREYTNKQ
jgi:alanine racemase